MADVVELGDHTGDLNYPNWQRPVEAALVELDKNKLKERVAAAEAAISKGSKPSRKVVITTLNGRLLSTPWETFGSSNGRFLSSLTGNRNRSGHAYTAQETYLFDEHRNVSEF